MTDTTNTRLIHTLPHGDFPEIAHVESAVILFPNGTLSGNWKSRPNDRTYPYMPLEDHERIVAKAVRAALERAAKAVKPKSRRPNIDESNADDVAKGAYWEAEASCFLTIRALASTPSEVAAIIKKAEEDR
jgi:hypothetical protein